MGFKQLDFENLMPVEKFINRDAVFVSGEFTGLSFEERLQVIADISTQDLNYEDTNINESCIAVIKKLEELGINAYIYCLDSYKDISGPYVIIESMDKIYIIDPFSRERSGSTLMSITKDFSDIDKGTRERLISAEVYRTALQSIREALLRRTVGIPPIIQINNDLSLDLRQLKPKDFGKYNIVDMWIKPESLAFYRADGSIVCDGVLEEIQQYVEDIGARILMCQTVTLGPDIYSRIHPHGIHANNRLTFAHPMEFILVSGLDKTIYQKLAELKRAIRSRLDLSIPEYTPKEGFINYSEGLHTWIHSSDDPFEAYLNTSGIWDPRNCISRFSQPAPWLLNNMSSRKKLK